MTTQITITLSDEVYEQVKRFARLANRDVTSVLADTIHSSVPLISEESAALESIIELSNQEVLALTELQMQPTEDARLSELLDKQQAGLLSEAERPELQKLMQIYQESLLRKATAIAEAVQRGLMESLSE